MKTAKFVLPLSLMLVSLALLGCPKKPPRSAPVAAPVVSAPVAPTTEIRAETSPGTLSDQVEVDPLADPDIASLNAHVRDRGLLGDVYFDFDRAELRGEARERLARNGEFLRSRPEFLVTIEGHCDERAPTSTTWRSASAAPPPPATISSRSASPRPGSGSSATARNAPSAARATRAAGGRTGARTSS